jgi:hypothetical protein
MSAFLKQGEKNNTIPCKAVLQKQEKCGIKYGQGPNLKFINCFLKSTCQQNQKKTPWTKLEDF